MSNYRSMYFGTENRMIWIPAPLAGADVSPSGFYSPVEYINGGAYVNRTPDTHARDAFTWSAGSSDEFANELIAYAQGVYGDTIYYHNPRNYMGNILPAKWAAPHLNTTQGVASICRGITPVAVPNESGYGPPMGARFNIPNGPRGRITPTSKDPVPGALVMPLPPNTTFRWNFNYTSRGSSSGIYYRYKGVGDPDSGYSNWVRTSTTTEWNQLSGTASGRVVQFAVGKTINGAASVILNSLRALLVGTPSLYPQTLPPYDEWLPGSGHSGMRFVDMPQHIMNSNAQYGGLSYVAANFVEVGSWL